MNSRPLRLSLPIVCGVAALVLSSVPATAEGEGQCESRYVGGLGFAPDGSQAGYGAFIGCEGTETAAATIEISWLPGTTGSTLVDVVDDYEVDPLEPHDSIIRVSCGVELGLARCESSGSRPAEVTYDPLGPVTVRYRLSSPAWLWIGHWTATNVRNTGVLWGGGSFRLHWEFE